MPKPKDLNNLEISMRFKLLLLTILIFIISTSIHCENKIIENNIFRCQSNATTKEIISHSRHLKNLCEITLASSICKEVAKEDILDCENCNATITGKITN